MKHRTASLQQHGYLFYTKYYAKIPVGSPLAWVSNAGAMKHCNFQPISLRLGRGAITDTNPYPQSLVLNPNQPTRPGVFTGWCGVSQAQVTVGLSLPDMRTSS